MTEGRDWRIGALAWGLGTPFGAAVAAALGVQMPIPYFYGEAWVRDGVIYAGFVDRDTIIRPSVAVGTFDEIEAEMRRCADGLKLSDKERAAFLQAMNEWVGAPFQKDARHFKWSDGTVH